MLWLLQITPIHFPKKWVLNYTVQNIKTKVVKEVNALKKNWRQKKNSNPEGVASSWSFRYEFLRIGLSLDICALWSRKAEILLAFQDGTNRAYSLYLKTPSNVPYIFVLLMRILFVFVHISPYNTRENQFSCYSQKYYFHRFLWCWLPKRLQMANCPILL